MRNFKIALAQFSPHIGNITANAQKMLEQAQQAQQQGADIVVFPELAFIGYPAEDLLLRPSLATRMQQGLAILQQARDMIIIAGYVDIDESGQRYNAAALIKNGKILATYHKQNLPNYGVFDEQRYFQLEAWLGWTINLLIAELIIYRLMTKKK